MVLKGKDMGVKTSASLTLFFGLMAGTFLLNDDPEDNTLGLFNVFTAAIWAFNTRLDIRKNSLDAKAKYKEDPYNLM